MTVMEILVVGLALAGIYLLAGPYGLILTGLIIILRQFIRSKKR